MSATEKPCGCLHPDAPAVLHDGHCCLLTGPPDAGPDTPAHIATPCHPHMLEQLRAAVITKQANRQAGP